MRLFVAVNLPEDVRRQLAAAVDPLRRSSLPVKWVDVAGIHLTLKFLGAVDAAREVAIRDAMTGACKGARPFDLPIGGFGAFPSPERVRVIWVGCEATPALELLQHGVEREFAAIGFPVEGRPFRPHLTLGRARPDAGSGIRGLAERLADLVVERVVRVESVELMESTLSPTGARYTVRHSVSLAA